MNANAPYFVSSKNKLKKNKTMKKVFVILFMTVMMAQGAFAQSRQNVIKLNPLSGLLRTANVSYERALTSSSSLQLGFFFSGIKIGDVRYRGFGITPEYRFYLQSKKQAPEGLYVAPFARFQKFTLSDTESSSKASLNTIGGGVVAGCHWLVGESFSIDLFIGPSFNAGDVKAESEGEEVKANNVFSGFGLRTGITIGFAF
jgi:hypothetical protein